MTYQPKTIRVRAGNGIAWWNLIARIGATGILAAFALHLDGLLQLAAWVGAANMAWRAGLTVKALLMIRAGELAFEDDNRKAVA